jgi:Fe-S cluster biosynthesis and repair protein YggX
MSIHCTRCDRDSEPPPAHRIGFTGEGRQRVLSAICSACWKEWEAVEVRVINEYRLNLLEPEHRESLKRSCLDFLKLG